MRPPPREAPGLGLLDREPFPQAAAGEHVPDAGLERPGGEGIRLVDAFRLHPPHRQYIHGLTEAARQAAARGSIVLVGRGAGHLITDSPNVLHLRLVAPSEWRAQRMALREGWTFEEALARVTEEDRN